MHVSSFSFVLLALGVGAPGEPVERPPEVCRDLVTQLDSIMASPAVEGASVGVYIERLDDRTPLYERDADAQLVPASNIKIISTAAALSTLGPDHHFQTELFGRVDDKGTVQGGLYVRGDGDPWLIPERVWYLASRLYFMGVRQIRGDIIVDDTHFVGDRMALGWEQDRSSYAYMAPRGAVSVGFNTLVVHIYPAKVAGMPAEIMVEPTSSYARLEANVETVARGRSRLDIDVVPEKDRSVLKVSGQIHLREPGRGYYRRVDNPPVFAGEVLREMLKQVGIAMRGGRVRTGIVPEGAERLAVLPSPPLSQLLNRVNKHSNNFMAEQIAMAAGAARYGAPGDWDKAQRAIEAFLVERVGLQPGQFAIRNASGLHDVNRFSPRQVVAVLRTMYNDPRLRPEFVASMSVAGGSGTLASRMRDTDALGLLRAKTGTLSISSALSGYVTAKHGETLGFSILINDYKAPISEVWAAQDEVGVALAALDTKCGTPSQILSRPTTSHAVPAIDELAGP